MILFSKYPYEFTSNDGKETFSITPDKRCRAPDWVAKNELFGLAVHNGRIEVLSPKASELNEAELTALRAQAKKLKITGYTKMSAEELQVAIAEKEVAAAVATE